MKTLLPLLRDLLTKNIRFALAAMLLMALLCTSNISRAQVWLTTAGGTVGSDIGDGMARIGYDGSGYTTLASSVAPITNFTAIDYAGNQAFIYNFVNTSPVTTEIKVVNLANGSVKKTITVPNQIVAIKYDAVSGFIYYLTTSAGGNSLQLTDALRKVKPDGTLDQLVVSSITTTPILLALDLPHNRVFVVDQFGASIKLNRIDFGSLPTNSTSTTLVSQSNTITQIAYNTADGYVYFTQLDGSYKTAGANDAIKKIDGSAGTGTTASVVASAYAYSATLFSLDAGHDRAYFFEGGNVADAPIKKTLKSITLSTGVVNTTNILVINSQPGVSTLNAINVPQIAVLSTAAAASVTATGASLGGNITQSDLSVTERGVVYSSTNTTPTIGGSGVTKASNGSGTGSFSAAISGLSGSTAYYVRSYATSTAGTAYGDVISFATPSNDANLSAFTISSGTLSPAFAAGTTTYTASVTNATTSLTVTPTRNQGNATIKVNNATVTSGSASGSLNLSIGDNIITTVVTAQDGTTTKTYTLTVNRAKAAQTITFAATASKTFGNPDFGAGATTGSGLTISYISSNTGVATVSGSTIHIVGAGSTIITASQAGDASYLPAGNATQTLTVDKASQTITFNALAAKTYGNADFAPGATATSSLNVTYSSDNSAVATIVSNQVHIVGQGNATITAVQAGNSNYNVATNATQTLNVGKATIAITANAQTKIYGDNDPTFTYTATGVVGSDAPTGALSRATPNTNVFIGTYAIDQGTLSYGGNYNITYTGANLTITKRPITVLPIAKTKIYGDADPFLNQIQITAGSLALGDATSGAFGRAASESVGSYLMTLGNKKVIYGGVTDITNNYDITVQPAYFTITAKPVTVNANAQTKTYGDADPAFTYSSDALAFSDSFTGSLTRAAGESFGTYAINKGTLALSGNYTLTFNGNNLTIGKKTINVTANAQTKLYGEVDPAFTYTSDALATGDNFTGALGRVAGENVGNYAIAQGTLALNSNYTINFASANLSIYKANLFYVATPASRSYGAADPAFTGNVTGFANGESVASATTGTLSFTTPATATSNIGNYALFGGGLSANNYDFVQAQSNNYALSITQATLTYVATPVTRNYGEPNPAFTGSVTGFVNGETVGAATTGTLGFTTTAFPYNAVGTYPITGDGLTANNANYTFVQDAANSHALTIALSSNANLATLSIENSTFDQPFSPANTNYTASVDAYTYQTRVTATTEQAGATILVNGRSLVYGGESTEYFTLNFGENIINTVVTAQDGTTKTYKTVLTRKLDSNAKLSGIFVTENGTTLTPDFDQDVHTYTMDVPNSTSYVRAFLVKSSSYATMTVNGEPSSDGDLFPSLVAGSNVFIIKVTAQDLTTAETYTLTINRALSANNLLSNLTLANATISPGFDANTSNYNATVDNWMDTGQIQAVTADTTARYTVNGNAVAAGDVHNVTLNTGENTFNIAVKAQNGDIKDYKLVVTRVKSTDAGLSNLTVSSGTLSPYFEGGGPTEFTVNVLSNVSTFNVTPRARNVNATIKVNGATVVSGNNSQSIALTYGANDIHIVVTAQDGVTITDYKVTVTRVAPSGSSNAALTSIGIDPVAALSGATGSANVNYQASVSFGVSSVRVKANAQQANAVIRVNGTVVNSGDYSGPIVLGGASTVINVLITAQDGVTTKTYSITVNRTGSNNAALTSIGIDPVAALSVATGTASVNYQASVSFGVSSVRVKANAQQLDAVIRVNGTVVNSGDYSGPIVLGGASTVINVLITAQDGVTTKTYSITVNRTGSSNAALTSIGIDPVAALSVATGTASVNYQASVSFGVSSVRVKAIAQQLDAVIRVNGTVVNSGDYSDPIVLGGASTVINVLITAQDGVNTKTYSITVNRTGSNNAALTAIGIDPVAALSGATGTANVNYQASVSFGVSSVRVKAIAQQLDAVIRVNGTVVNSGDYSGPIVLGGASTVINVLITAQDGVTTKTYSLTVNRSLSTLMVNKADSKLLFANKAANNIAPTGNDGVVVHQGVSPNGDGSNDFLYIEGIDAYPGNKLAIMNGNGSLVFDAKDYGKDGNNLFDGHSNKNGALLKSGTYYYSLEYNFNKQAKRKTGYIIIKY
jgi:gliding motility-associated-like protein